MSDVDLFNLLHKAEYVAFEVARTASFFIVLWQLIDKHFQIKAGVIKFARVLVEINDKEKKPLLTSKPADTGCSTHQELR
jgi:hypothetical protein